MDKIDILTSRIAERLEALGMSERQASLEATGKPDALRYIRTRRAMPSLPRLIDIAVKLKTTPSYLLGGSDSPEVDSMQQRVLEHADIFAKSAFLDLVARPNLAEEAHGIVVDSIIETHEIMTGIDNSPILVGFAAMRRKIIRLYREPEFPEPLHTGGIICPDATMSPAFDRGGLVIHTGEQRPQSGDYGLFFLKKSSLPDDRPGLVFTLKKLLEDCGDHLVLQQHNPAQQFKLDKDNLHTAERVLRYDDLVYQSTALMPQK